MNRDDIHRMAWQCGLTINDKPMLGVEHFAKLVAAAEREACARLCEAEANQWRGRDSDAYAAVWDCVHAILKRGKA